MEFNLTLTWWDLWLYEKKDSLNDLFEYILKQPKIRGVFLLINNLRNERAKTYIELLSEKIIGIQLNTDIIEKRIEDIKYLLDKKYNIYFKIMLSKNNDVHKQINLISAIFNKFNNHENLYASIDRLCPTRIEDNINVLEKSELKNYLELIKNKFGNKFITEDPFIKAFLWIDNTDDESLYWCAIPFWWLSIFPDWTIKLCSRAYYINTWYHIDNFKLLKYIKKFSINRNKNAECIECWLFKYCQWWCPAISYIKDPKEIIKKDSQCFLNN